MKGTILITDSLFIAPEHEDTLTAAGYAIERLDVPKPTEDQFVRVFKDKKRRGC